MVIQSVEWLFDAISAIRFSCTTKQTQKGWQVRDLASKGNSNSEMDLFMGRMQIKRLALVKALWWTEFCPPGSLFEVFPFLSHKIMGALHFLQLLFPIDSTPSLQMLILFQTSCLLHSPFWTLGMKTKNTTEKELWLSGRLLAWHLQGLRFNPGTSR